MLKYNPHLLSKENKSHILKVSSLVILYINIIYF